MVLGWDTSYFEGVTTGWAFSYGSGSVDSNAPGAASNDVKSYTFNLYGSQMLGNGAFISGLVGAGYDQYDTKRTILGVGSATGSTTGYHATARLEAGVDVPMWDIVTLTPLIGTQYTYASMDKYTEEGAGNAGLMVKPGTMGTLDMTAGLELKTYIPLSDFSYLRPSLRLAYTRRTGDDAFSTTSQFIAGGQTFASNGFGDSKNFITVGGALGLINSQGTDLSLSYDAELRDAMFGYSAQMKAKFMF
jgi:outer membrane autotransporter protein